MASSGEQRSKSVSQLEAELAASRARLASTIDELTVRAQPKAIVRRQVESTRAKLYTATHTPTGELRTERVAAVLAACSAVLVLLGLLRRRRG